MLVASGQLKLSELSKRSKNNKSNDLFIEEVVINDTPMSARNFLTRSSTQEEISKVSMICRTFLGIFIFGFSSWQFL